MDISNAQEYLTCLICLELSKNAVECNKCSNIMCEECAKSLKKRECPSCRQVDFTWKPSILARRMIGSLPCTCPNDCGYKTTVGNLDDHLKKCPNKIYVCGGVEECKFEGKKEEFLKHLVEAHESTIISMFDSQIKNDIEETK